METSSSQSGARGSRGDSTGGSLGGSLGGSFDFADDESLNAATLVMKTPWDEKKNKIGFVDYKKV